MYHATKTRLEGERKQVTVLFADVTGSMELAERTEPEEFQALMARLFAILSDGVHRFGGTVDTFTGDGIMALFGAPIAHEDHARRACYATLQLRDELVEYATELRRSRGLDLPVRMGLNSGEVVAGSIGDDRQPVYTAVGRTVGLAQRVEELAEPGTACVTEATAKLVEGYVNLRDLGTFEVRGVREKVRVYELAGIGPVRSAIERSRSRGFSRFVGRAEEMRDLEAALDNAMAGEGQIVGITGEPGVGKSRLCHEFSERCRARGFAVYQTQGHEQTRSIPLEPVTDLVENQSASMVIVIDDLHLADPGTEAFVGAVADVLPSSGGLMVVSFRPEYRAPWMARSYYRQVPVVPMGGAAIDALLADLLGPDPSLDGLRELIGARVAGNPLFIEELVQALVEAGNLEGSRGSYRLTRTVDHEALPAGVIAVLGARIDRLGQREKTVLQTAAVIGREFSQPVLAAATGLAERQLEAAVDELVAAEYIYRQALYPQRQYAFEHPLTCEVAYGSLLGERRASAHEAVARAIEQQSGQLVEEQSAVIAHHYEQARREWQRVRRLR